MKGLGWWPLWSSPFWAFTQPWWPALTSLSSSVLLVPALWRKLGLPGCGLGAHRWAAVVSSPPPGFSTACSQMVEWQLGGTNQGFHQEARNTWWAGTAPHLPSPAPGLCVLILFQGGTSLSGPFPLSSGTVRSRWTHLQSCPGTGCVLSSTLSPPAWKVLWSFPLGHTWNTSSSINNSSLSPRSVQRSFWTLSTSGMHLFLVLISFCPLRKVSLCPIFWKAGRLLVLTTRPYNRAYDDTSADMSYEGLVHVYSFFKVLLCFISPFGWEWKIWHKYVEVKALLLVLGGPAFLFSLSY